MRRGPLLRRVKLMVLVKSIDMKPEGRLSCVAGLTQISDRRLDIVENSFEVQAMNPFVRSLAKARHRENELPKVPSGHREVWGLRCVRADPEPQLPIIERPNDPVEIWME